MDRELLGARGSPSAVVMCKRPKEPGKRSLGVGDGPGAPVGQLKL